MSDRNSLLMEVTSAFSCTNNSSPARPSVVLKNLSNPRCTPTIFLPSRVTTVMVL